MLILRTQAAREKYCLNYTDCYIFMYSSVPLPKDAGHFKRERKIALTKALQVQY
jgi:hypothetical protein